MLDRNGGNQQAGDGHTVSAVKLQVIISAKIAIVNTIVILL